MDPRHLELAAELGQLSGKRDLIEYLDLGPDATASEAKAALRARRKRMQGMQANPKFRREAVFLIKHTASLEQLLNDLDGYRQAAVESHEATQVPILEIAIRGALAGGPLTPAQRGHVHEMARRLGISDQTFEQTLQRIIQTEPPAPAREPNGARPPERPSRSASNTAPTAPPMRPRTHTPSLGAGPPPVPGFAARGQTLGLNRDAAPATMQVVGDPIRYVALGAQPVVHEIRVRKTTSGPLPARVSADAGWLTVSPRVLDPDRTEQTISVHVTPSLVSNAPQSAMVHIVSEGGGRASIVFEAFIPEPERPRTAVYAGLIAVALLLLLAIGFVARSYMLATATP